MKGVVKEKAERAGLARVVETKTGMRGRAPPNRGRGRGERDQTQHSTQSTDPIKDAEAAAQRARRRPVGDSLDALATAAAAFRAATAAPLPPDRVSDAWFGLANTLQCLAERTVAAAARAPDGVVTATSERGAAAAAVTLLDEAVAAFAHPSLQGVAAAAVNGANALTSAAEAVVLAAAGDDTPAAITTARALVARAITAYDTVLASTPDDTDTAVNRADALKQAGDLALDAGDTAAAQAALTAADSAYAASVSTASSDDGDDIPSILHNWGVALHSASRAEGGAAALEAAAARLREAAAFARGDVAPLLALGDVLCDAAGEAAGSGLPGADPVSHSLLSAAVSDGYNSALEIDRKCADGNADVAEVELTLARAAAASGDGDRSRTHAADSARAYSRALADPHKLGGWGERASARFNAACALCLAGEVERARAAVVALVASGAATEAEVAADADLTALRVEL